MSSNKTCLSSYERVNLSPNNTQFYELVFKIHACDWSNLVGAGLSISAGLVYFTGGWSCYRSFRLVQIEKGAYSVGHSSVKGKVCQRQRGLFAIIIELCYYQMALFSKEQLIFNKCGLFQHLTSGLFSKRCTICRLSNRKRCILCWLFIFKSYRSFLMKLCIWAQSLNVQIQGFI